MAASAVRASSSHGAGSETPTRQRKKASVKQLSKLIGEHPLVALVAIRGVPASALQTMRRDLAAAGNPLRVAPNSMIVHALKDASKGRPALEKLLPLVTDQTALLLSKSNPFVIYKALDRTRQPAPARGGEVAPKDIGVLAGETSFKPGPITGELQHAGFPAAIEKGKVVMKKDAIIVRKGEVIKAEVATMLTRLEIFPLEVGLMLRAAVEGDTFYPPADLSIDLDALRADVGRAHRQALGVAVELAWPAPESIPLIIARAHRQATALSVEAAFPTPETLPALFNRAVRQARALERLQTS